MAILITTRATGAQAPNPAPATSATGSRRRRLWELDSHTHCPVIGVCLPLARLRRLCEKTAGLPTDPSDYALHCLAVTESRHRGALAEALQKELEQRYAQVVRAAQALKSGPALERWWQTCRDQGDWAGPFWATLTHPHCDALMETRLLGEVHMLQHQVGMCERTDHARLDALHRENAVLARELAGAQGRTQEQARHYMRQIENLQATVLQLRAQLIQAQTRQAQQEEALQSLRAAHPDLPSRLDLLTRQRALTLQVQDLHRALQQASQPSRTASRPDGDAPAAQPCIAATTPAPPSVHETACRDAAPATGCSVLCVGGRTAIVPVYREIIEDRGARFLHHDGGQEDHLGQLDATLAAADLVICQSGCISHNAYWRVKDHCKRTGKQCVFVETPSRSALERALTALDQTTTGSGSSRMPKRS